MKNDDDDDDDDDDDAEMGPGVCNSFFVFFICQ